MREDTRFWKFGCGAEDSPPSSWVRVSVRLTYRDDCDDDFDRAFVPVRAWLREANLSGAFCWMHAEAIFLAEEDGNPGEELDDMVVFAFSDPVAAFAFKMRWC